MAKITFEDLEELVTEVKYFYWDTLTICVVEVENGYKAVGTSSCADPAEYNKDLGEELAYKDAINKLWPLEGYLLKEMASWDELDDYINEDGFVEDVFVEDDPIDSERNDL